MVKKTEPNLLPDLWMQKPNGFFLIELLVYLVIFSSFIVLFMRTIVFSVHQLGIQNNQAYAVAQLYATEQQMIRDFERAPAGETDWNCVADTQVVWHAENTDIGWCFENNMLVRREGIYDTEKQQWKKKTTNIGAKNIEKGSFTLSWASNGENEQQVSLISMTLETNNNKKSINHTFCVSPRNRALT